MSCRLGNLLLVQDMVSPSDHHLERIIFFVRFTWHWFCTKSHLVRSLKLHLLVQNCDLSLYFASGWTSVQKCGVFSVILLVVNFVLLFAMILPGRKNEEVSQSGLFCVSSGLVWGQWLFSLLPRSFEECKICFSFHICMNMYWYRSTCVTYIYWRGHS